MLGRERRAQVERVQTICKTIMHIANPILKDCEQQPPVDPGPLKSLQDCLKNLESAREKIVTLCGEMAVIKPEAWGE